MHDTSKTRFKKTFRQLLFGFVLLFIFRLLYGYTTVTDSDSLDINFVNETGSSSRNYATDKIALKKTSMEPPSGGQPQAKELNQKYEKIASVRSKTSRFEQDEAQAKRRIKDFGAVIQYEQNSGNPGSRTMQLQVGIQPEKFDSFYLDIQKIGSVLSKQVTKTDKTNEYRQLNAQVTSLEKVRGALMDLKGKGGRIDEFIGLENRILEIEEQLQELGVKIGNYDEENEFCTVKFALQEGQQKKITFLHRLKVALEWAAKYYLIIITGLCVALFVANLLLIVLDKLGVLSNSSNKPS